MHTFQILIQLGPQPDTMLIHIKVSHHRCTGVLENSVSGCIQLLMGFIIEVGSRKKYVICSEILITSGPLSLQW